MISSFCLSTLDGRNGDVRHLAKIIRFALGGNRDFSRAQIALASLHFDAADPSSP
jgi:hypothetical protein